MAGASPPDKRRILCVHCSRPLEVDVGAKSVNCRHCHKRVITEALTVKDYVAVRRFETANRLHITKKGIVYAAVRADDLVVDGVLEGSALALGGRHLRGAPAHREGGGHRAGRAGARREAGAPEGGARPGGHGAASEEDDGEEEGHEEEGHEEEGRDEEGREEEARDYRSP
jgi:hypothetical protein